MQRSPRSTRSPKKLPQRSQKNSPKKPSKPRKKVTETSQITKKIIRTALLTTAPLLEPRTKVLGQPLRGAQPHPRTVHPNQAQDPIPPNQPRQLLNTNPRHQPSPNPSPPKSSRPTRTSPKHPKTPQTPKPLFSFSPPFRPQAQTRALTHPFWSATETAGK